MAKEKNIKLFNKDVKENEGYYYTKTSKLSCRLANQRLTQAVVEATDLSGKKIIDIGCGDGTYTFELLVKNPDYILGIDAAEVAISTASKKASEMDNIEFQVLDIYKLDSLQKKFDIAIIRGVLHHLYDVEKVIDDISKVADEVIIIEPNGYNPVLKIIEKTSRYHIEHEEKSYFPFDLRKWFARNQGTLEKSSYCGLVPMFCPDIMARILKTIEPFVEKTPLLKQLSCAVYAMKFRFPAQNK